MVPSVNSITFWRVPQKRQMAFRLQIKLVVPEIEKTIIDFQLVVSAAIGSKSLKFFSAKSNSDQCEPLRAGENVSVDGR